MFQVEIKNLKTKAHIGITERERKNPQPLLVTLRFNYVIDKKNQINNIKYLKDYSDITSFLKSFIETSRYRSLEKLVEECSQILKKRYKLKKTFLSINKINVAKRYGCESLSVSK